MNKEIKEIIDVKQRNNKELINLKDFLVEKQFKRKVNYTKFLYDLKFKFIAKEQEYKERKYNLLIAKIKK